MYPAGTQRVDCDIDVCCWGQSGSWISGPLGPLMAHLRHRLNDEQTDNGHNFLRPRGRSVKPVEKNGLAQRHGVLVGCAAASMRYHDEIRVFSLAGATLHSGNTLWKS